MAYTDDWESLMNGVFGPGGKLKFSQSTPQAAQPKPEKPEKTQDGPLPDWNAALLAQQKKLDEMLKQQNAALKGQDAATKSALEDSRKMLRSPLAKVSPAFSFTATWLMPLIRYSTGSSMVTILRSLLLSSASVA